VTISFILVICIWKVLDLTLHLETSYTYIRFSGVPHFLPENVGMKPYSRHCLLLSTSFPVQHSSGLLAEGPYEFAWPLQTNAKIVSQIGHSHFLPNPFQFIISLSFFHSTLFSRNCCSIIFVLLAICFGIDC
jgi:hypothetical protein